MENYFSTNIKYLRESKQLSQEEMAKKLFNSNQRVKISNLETGRCKNCGIEDAKAYAEYFGYTIDDLVNKDFRIPHICEKRNEDSKLEKSVRDFPIYKEKYFRNIPNINVAPFICFAAMQLLLFIIRMLQIGTIETKNIICGIFTSISIGYMVYILVSSTIESKKNVEKIYLLESKKFFYLNNAKFSVTKYIIINLLLLLVMLVIMSTIFVYAENSFLYFSLVMYIIDVSFVLTCISLSLKRKLKKSNNISYMLYSYEKIKSFLTVIMLILILFSLNVYVYNKYIYIIDTMFIFLLYYLTISSRFLINKFYQNYFFEVK